MTWYTWRIGRLAYAPLQSARLFAKSRIHVGREVWASFGPFFWQVAR